MSQTVVRKDEEKAMEAVRRELGSGLGKSLFAQLWHHVRECGDLRGHDAGQFAEDPAVRAEAVEVLRESAALAQIGWDARAAPHDDGSPVSPAARLLEARRPGRWEQDEGESPTTSTALRSEAMALLIADLAAEREDVREYRRTLESVAPSGLLDADRVDDYLDGLDEEQSHELLRITLDVCGAYGLHLAQSMDLVLAGRPPELRPVRMGEPERGSTVRQMHISCAPWASPEDAASALRRAQLRAARLQEHKARAEKNKREAMARYERGEAPRGRGLRPWRDDPAYTPPLRRPNLDTRGKRVSGPGDVSVRMFVFVARRRREMGERQSWGEMMAAWNAEQKDKNKRYTNERSFSTNYRRTRAALIAWLPSPLPRLVLEPERE